MWEETNEEKLIRLQEEMNALQREANQMQAYFLNNAYPRKRDHIDRMLSALSGHGYGDD